MEEIYLVLGAPGSPGRTVGQEFLCRKMQTACLARDLAKGRKLLGAAGSFPRPSELPEILANVRAVFLV